MSHLWITGSQPFIIVNPATALLLQKKKGVALLVAILNRHGWGSQYFYHFATQDVRAASVPSFVQAGLRSAAATCLPPPPLPQRAAHLLSYSCCTGSACGCCQLSIFNCFVRVEFSTEDRCLNAIILPLHKAFIYSCSIYISNL